MCSRSKLASSARGSRPLGRPGGSDSWLSLSRSRSWDEGPRSAALASLLKRQSETRGSAMRGAGAKLSSKNAKKSKSQEKQVSE